MQIRRAVTGHDSAGKAQVVIDEVSSDLLEVRPGATFCNLWSSTLPASNDVIADGAKEVVGTAMTGRSVFRIIEYKPGVSPRYHRTASLDYGVVLSGEILMRMDGSEVQLRAGDTFVQRGTVHDWINDGDDPCLIAFVLIDAHPLISADGESLPAVG